MYKYWLLLSREKYSKTHNFKSKHSEFTSWLDSGGCSDRVQTTARVVRTARGEHRPSGTHRLGSTLHKDRCHGFAGIPRGYAAKHKTRAQAKAGTQVTCQRHIQSAICRGAHVESKITDVHTAQTQSAKMNAKRTEQECAELQTHELNQGLQMTVVNSNVPVSVLGKAYWRHNPGAKCVSYSACVASIVSVIHYNSTNSNLQITRLKCNTTRCKQCNSGTNKLACSCIASVKH